jgi:Ca-activated chloride channel family protein
MIHFEWPWLFALLPLPWFYRRLLTPAPPVEEAALRVPFLQDFERAGFENTQRSSQRWPLWLAAIAWGLLVTASTRPQWLGEAIQLPVSGRDLLLAVDLSGSMAEEDFVIRGKTVDRLTATKWVAGDFIKRRQGDRIGLILFGEQAYLQTPLTFDRQTVTTLLQESAIGLAGKSTALGDAIGLAIKRLRKQHEANRILILLTDGANTAGVVNPLNAADLAAQEGVKIYTIGIGADEMIVRDIFGSRRINPSNELDETTLKTIADKTGGRYFRARDTAQLQLIYTMLDKLEPVEQDARSFRPKIALFPWPLGTALMLAALLLIGKINGRIQ